jgi:hypothetical protein
MESKITMHPTMNPSVSPSAFYSHSKMKAGGCTWIRQTSILVRFDAVANGFSTAAEFGGGAPTPAEAANLWPGDDVVPKGSAPWKQRPFLSAPRSWLQRPLPLNDSPHITVCGLADCYGAN